MSPIGHRQLGKCEVFDGLLVEDVSVVELLSEPPLLVDALQRLPVGTQALVEGCDVPLGVNEERQFITHQLLEMDSEEGANVSDKDENG